MVFASVYEITDAICTVRKQRFWCWFSGDVLHPRWTTYDIVGCNTFEMGDDVDGGFKVITGTGGANRGGIGFNNINHYCEDASVFIIVARRVTSSANNIMGLGSGGCAVLDSGDNSSMMSVRNHPSISTNFQLFTSTASSNGSNDTCVARDEVYHSFKLCNSCGCSTLTIDGGCVDATRTLTLPTVTQEPFFFSWKGGAICGGAENRIRYIEAFNK